MITKRAQKIIGFFDLDGVIIDHATNKIKLAKQRGYFLKPAQTSSNIMKKFIPLENYRKIQKDVYGRMSLSSKPMKGAKKIIKKIARLYPDLYLISRRDRKDGGGKFALQWLKNHKFFPPLNRKKIFFVDSDIGKDPLCKKLGINVYLDDKIKVLNNLPSVKYRVLFDSYGHYYKNPPPGIKVIKTWKEFYKYLLELAKNQN